MEARPQPPEIAAIPKADLHLHQEAAARLNGVVARREGRPPFDWRAWAGRVMDEVPPGLPRLDALYAPDAALPVPRTADADPELFIARVADVLEEGAAAGAVLLEVRFGAEEVVARPDFMALFRAAERRVAARYPRLRAEALAHIQLAADPERRARAERHVEACLGAAGDGLAGVDFLVQPYAAEADPALWAVAYGWAERAAGAGLGITVHAGEFSPANLAAALRVPGLGRLGHALYGAEPDLLEPLVRSGVAVECSLTSNVVLGAVPSYAAHPFRRLAGAGVPVTLNTDLPVHLDVTIGREYALAAALGWTQDDLLACTRNAIRASFTSEARRTALLAEL